MFNSDRSGKFLGSESPIKYLVDETLVKYARTSPPEVLLSWESGV